MALVQAGKYEGLQGSDLPGAVGRDFPKLDIKKPTFFSGSNDVVSSNVAAVQLGLTGMSFSACAVPLSPVGANVSPTVSAVPLSQHHVAVPCVRASCQRSSQQLPRCCVQMGSMHFDMCTEFAVR